MNRDVPRDAAIFCCPSGPPVRQPRRREERQPLRGVTKYRAGKVAPPSLTRNRFRSQLTPFPRQGFHSRGLGTVHAPSGRPGPGGDRRRLPDGFPGPWVIGAGGPQWKFLHIRTFFPSAGSPSDGGRRGLSEHSGPEKGVLSLPDEAEALAPSSIHVLEGLQ